MLPMLHYRCSPLRPNLATKVSKLQIRRDMEQIEFILEMIIIVMMMTMIEITKIIIIISLHISLNQVHRHRQNNQRITYTSVSLQYKHFRTRNMYLGHG